MVNQIIFSWTLQIWYIKVRISRSISESPLELEITRVDYFSVLSIHFALIQHGHLADMVFYLDTSNRVMKRLRFIFKPSYFSLKNCFCIPASGTDWIKCQAYKNWNIISTVPGKKVFLREVQTAKDQITLCILAVWSGSTCSKLNEVVS